MKRAAAGLVALLLAWPAWEWWSDRQDTRHCGEMVEQEGNLEAGARMVETEVGPVAEPDGLAAAQRSRALQKVRAEIQRCIDEDVPLR